MKIHYFYKRDYHKSWFHIQLQAISEEEIFSTERQRQESSFMYIEVIRCFISKDMERFQTSDFKIEFGRNSCFGHCARSVDELYKDKLNRQDSTESFQLITRAQYERLRRLAIYVNEKNKFMDFDKVKTSYVWRI